MQNFKISRPRECRNLKLFQVLSRLSLSTNLIIFIAAHLELECRSENLESAKNLHAGRKIVAL